MTTEMKRDPLDTIPDRVDESGVHDAFIEATGTVPYEARVFGSAIETSPLPLIRKKSDGAERFAQDDIQLIREELAQIMYDMESRELSDIMIETMTDNCAPMPLARMIKSRSRMDTSDPNEADSTLIIPVRWDWQNLTRLNPTEGMPYEHYADLVYGWDTAKKQAKADWTVFSRNTDIKLSALEMKVFQEYQVFIQYLLCLHGVLQKRESAASALKKTKVLGKQYRWALNSLEKRDLSRIQSARKVLHDERESKHLLLHPDLRSIIFSDAFGGLLEIINEVLAYQNNPAANEFPTLMSVDVEAEIDVLLELVKKFIKMSGSLQLWWVHEKKHVPFPQLFAEKMTHFFKIMGRKFI